MQVTTEPRLQRLDLLGDLAGNFGLDGALYAPWSRPPVDWRRTYEPMRAQRMVVRPEP